MEQRNTENLDPEFFLADEIFLPTEPMSDDEFAQFVRVKSNEVPIEEVDFLSALPA